MSASSKKSYRAQAEDFRRDGAVLMKSVLDTKELALAEEAYDWSLAHPSPSHVNYYPEQGAKFFIDTFNVKSWPVYQDFLAKSSLGRAVADVLDTKEMWMLYEQVFLKDGGACRRTPWHQDTSYMPMEGDKFGIAWISLDSVSKANALEFISGSHRGPLYNGSSFDPNDDTAPVFDEKDLPRLPDIEGNRAKWNIVSWAVEPGDVILFHPSALHGGASTSSQRRRTISLRFAGDDVVYAVRPKALGAADVGYDASGKPKLDLGQLCAGLKPGDKVRHPDLIKAAG